MKVYVVSLTEDGKWHCFDLSGDLPMHHLVGKGWYEQEASRLIRSLVNSPSRPWHTARDRHLCGFAIHAKNKYQAIKLAKRAHDSRLLPSY